MKASRTDIAKRAAARAREIRPKRREADVDSIEIDGEFLIYDLVDDSVHHLNQTAGILWQICDGSATLSQLAEDIADVFGVPPRTARRDVRVAVRGLGDAGLMEAPKPRKRRARHTHQHEPQGLEVGTEVPALRLPDLDGKTVSLEDFAGRSVVLVNWSARCGYCDRIAPELASLAGDLNARGVGVLFLSFGDPEENRRKVEEYGLAYPVLLRDGSADGIFDGMGTPSAYLLDEGGRIAEGLHVGADQVPVLARRAAGRADSEAGQAASKGVER